MHQWNSLLCHPGQCIDFGLSIGLFLSPFLACGFVSAEVTYGRKVTDIQIFLHK